LIMVVYRYAQTLDQVKVDFNNGATLRTQSSTPPEISDGLAAYWNMNEKTSSECIFGSTIYTYTGSDQTFTVPTGITSITTEMWGGGGGGGNAGGWNYGYPGGGAGYTTATLSVTPGQTLTVMVGAGGTKGSTTSTSESYGGGGRSCGGSDCQYGAQGGRSAIRYGSVI
jgi:hypothetical protein